MTEAISMLNICPGWLPMVETISTSRSNEEMLAALMLEIPRRAGSASFNGQM